ncbi:MAG: hypothetical protein ACK5GD_04720 [Planctomycetota bacterium]
MKFRLAFLLGVMFSSTLVGCGSKKTEVASTDAQSTPAPSTPAQNAPSSGSAAPAGSTGQESGGPPAPASLGSGGGSGGPPVPASIGSGGGGGSGGPPVPASIGSGGGSGGPPVPASIGSGGGAGGPPVPASIGSGGGPGGPPAPASLGSGGGPGGPPAAASLGSGGGASGNLLSAGGGSNQGAGISGVGFGSTGNESDPGAGGVGFAGVQGAGGPGASSTGNGGMQNSPSNTPPAIPEVELTLEDRAVLAFQAGNAPRAYALYQAHLLQVPNDEAQSTADKYRWDKKRIVPRMGYSFAVGLIVKKGAQVKELKPVGTPLAQLTGQGGGAAGGGGGFPGRALGGAGGPQGLGLGGPSGEAPAEGVRRLPAQELSDAAGNYAAAFVDAFNKAHSEGNWSEGFRDYSYGSLSLPPSLSGLTGLLSKGGAGAAGGAGGFGSFGGGLGGVSFGGPGAPTAGGGPPAGLGAGPGGPPAGYGGGRSGGPPAGYSGGGAGGPPAGYGGGGAGGPPAGYGGGGAGGPPAGYGGGGAGGPPAGYNGGGSGGPPAGYNGGGSGGPPAGYGGGGAGGPPAGYGGAAPGGAQPGAPSGGTPGLKFLPPPQAPQIGQGPGSGVGLEPGAAGLGAGSSPGSGASLEPGAAGLGAPGLGAGGLGAGFPGGGFPGGGPGFGGGAAAPSGPSLSNLQQYIKNFDANDIQLPSGWTALGSGLVYIGSGDSLADLTKRANEAHFDGLIVFEVDASMVIANRTIKNDCRIRAVNLKAAKDAKDKAFTSSSLNNREVALDKNPETKIDNAVSAFMQRLQEAYMLEDLPNLPAESVKKKRLPALAADTSRTVLDRLAEVQLYFSKGLIDETLKVDAFGAIAGPDGQVLATGTLDERLPVIARIIKRDYE